MHMMHRVTRIFFFKNLNLRLAETQVSEYMYYIYILQISSNWSSHYCIVKIFLPNLFLQQSLMPKHITSIITARDALKKKFDFEISLPWLLYIKSTQLNGNSIYICMFKRYGYSIPFSKIWRKEKGHSLPKAIKVTWVHIAHTKTCQGISYKHFLNLA